MAKTSRNKNYNPKYRSAKSGKYTAKRNIKKKSRRKKRDDDCFITTACVKSKGLADNCYELEALREFRDRFVLRQSNGKMLVNEYRKIAPLLIKKINKEKDPKIIYAFLYSQIKQACHLIEINRKKEALGLYINIVKNLITKYE